MYNHKYLDMKYVWVRVFVNRVWKVNSKPSDWLRVDFSNVVTSGLPGYGFTLLRVCQVTSWLETGSQPDSKTILGERRYPVSISLLLVIIPIWPWSWSSLSVGVPVSNDTLSSALMSCWRLQALHGLLDKASASLCMVLDRWTTVRL